MTTSFTLAFVSATLIISCGNPFHPSRPDPHDDIGVVVIIGTISSKAGRCPSANFEVTQAEAGVAQPMRVVTTPSTMISGREGCSGLAIGTQVEVEGNLGQDRVTASRIVVVPS